MAKKAKPKSAHPTFDSLSTKRQQFVLHYFESFNATQAYIDAKYSPNGAGQDAARLMNNERIRAAIAELMPRLGITPERINSSLAKIAWSADVAAYNDLLTGKKNLTEIAEGGVDTHMLKKVSVSTRVDGSKSVSVELHDSHAALRDLAKHLGMVIDKSQLEMTNGDLKGLGEAALLARLRATGPEGDGE